jgi:hypothetical protein
MMYRHKGQLIAMSDSDMTDLLDACEIGLRTSKFKYSDGGLVKSQAEEIKTGWPVEQRDQFKVKLKEIAGSNPISVSICRKALWAMTEALAQRRRKISQNSLETELLNVAGEIAMATVFGKTPLPADAQLCRTYTKNGKVIRVRCSTSPRRLVVNVDEVAQAQLYVLSLFDKVRNRAFLLGFATQEDVRAAKSGNKTTDADNCPWGKMAHYLDCQKLRPMSEFYQSHGITEVPEGVAFESVPNLELLPTPASMAVQEMLKPGEPDFDLMEYLTTPKKGAQTK